MGRLGDSVGALSRPARGEWIEKSLRHGHDVGFGVSPRKGRVD